MRQILGISCLLLVGSLASLAGGQVSKEVLCVRLCNTFAGKLHLPRVALSSAKVRFDNRTGGGAWTVFTPAAEYILGPNLDYVGAYADLSAPRPAARDARPFFRDFSHVATYARQVMRALAVPSAFSKWHVTDTGSATQNSFARNKVRVDFWEDLGGYGRMGVGNTLTATFDRMSGRLINLFDVRGWSADPPRLAITARQAMSRAASLVRGSVPTTRPALQYVPSNGAYGSRAGEHLARTHRLRLAYVVQTGSQVVFIDAETGKPLGGAAR